MKQETEPRQESHDDLYRAAFRVGNARLIDAAPALLEAARFSVQKLVEGKSLARAEAMKALVAAIQAATEGGE